MRLTAWAAAGLLVASPALADDEEDFSGRQCAMSAQCGPLKCIDRRCTDVETAARAWHGSVGHAAMFGDGAGYAGAIVATDVVATLVEPLLMLGAVASPAPTSTILGILCFVPVGLSGPFVHLVHGRWGAMTISFFTWTSLAATTFAVGGLVGLAFGRGELDSTAAWIAGLGFGGAGAALATLLDAWMARPAPVPRPDTSLRVLPAIVPMPGGVALTLAGTW